jgi:hypothetical protein
MKTLLSIAEARRAPGAGFDGLLEAAQDGPAPPFELPPMLARLTSNVSRIICLHYWTCHTVLGSTRRSLVRPRIQNPELLAFHEVFSITCSVLLVRVKRLRLITEFRIEST